TAGGAGPRATGWPVALRNRRPKTTEPDHSAAAEKSPRPPLEDVSCGPSRSSYGSESWREGDLALPLQGEVKCRNEPPEGGRINRFVWTMLQLSSTALFCGRASPHKLRHCGGGGHFKGPEPMRRVPALSLVAAQNRACGLHPPARA